MSSQSQRFAERVLSAFRDAGCVTDAEVAAAGGPSTTTMTKIRKAAEGTLALDRLRSDTLRAIDSAAMWEVGSAAALWDREVEPRRRATAVRAPAVLRGMPVEALLRDLAQEVADLRQRLVDVEADVQELRSAGPASGLPTMAQQREARRRRLLDEGLPQDEAAYDDEGPSVGRESHEDERP